MESLPANFLSGSGPKVDKFHVDWTQGLPDYDGLYAVVLDNVLSQAECDALLAAAVAYNGGQWERAMVRTGRFTQAMSSEVRNSDRIIWDSTEVAARLWKRCEQHVPELASLSNMPEVTGKGPVRRGEVWEMASLNERLRFLQYGPGEYFRRHQDGCYERSDGSERSYFTLHLYLNEKTDDNPLEGGATSFHSRSWARQNEDPDLDVVPKVGRVLIFQHSGLIHSGQEVSKGLKQTMRTDLMFKRAHDLLPEKKRMLVDAQKIRQKQKRQFLHDQRQEYAQ